MKAKWFILCMFALLVNITANAYDAEIDGIYYNFSGTNATVTYATTSYNSYSGDISIPASVSYNNTRYSVTEIGYRAFYNCRNLTSVIIPNSVKTISHYAFFNCTSLTSANLGSGVTTIGDAAFARSGIISISIPSSVTAIYSSAFNICSSLSSITVASGNSKYDSRSNCNAIIEKSTNYLILGCKNTVIPRTVKRIQNGAFYGCSDLSSITIPFSVSEIGERAFQDCSGLKSIIIASSVTNIDGYAFYQCEGLTKVIISDIAAWCNISFSNNYSNPLCYAKHIYNDADTEITNLTIPSNVTSIKSLAFYNCQGLKSVTLPYSLTSVSSYAFYGCTGLTKVIVPNISNWCNISFSDNYSNPLNYAKHIYSDADTEITNLTIPSNVSTIKAYSFIGCTGIKTITIPYSVNTIGYSAFEECSGLTKVIASNISKWCNISFSNWGANPLYYAKHLYSDANTEITNLTIPSNVTSIGAYSFIGCSGVKNITIPNGVNTIGYSAFEGCTGITSITLPYALTSISSSLLKGCTGLSSINIPSCVSTVGYNAFSGCTNLKTVTIPKSVNTIENSAFNGCNNLTLVKVYIESPISITNTTFSNRTNATLCVLRGCGAAYEAATYWTDFKDIVEVIDFVDATVKSKCVANWDTNGDGELSEIEAAAVTDLGRVFEGSNITSFEELQFFTGLTSIGAAAFSGCYDLRSVIIPEGILSIGNGAFAQTPIYEVKIPASVQTIGEYAFGGKWDDCPDNDESYCYVYYPVKYTVDSNNQAYASASGILYNKEKTKLIDVPYGLCQDIYFPSTLKEIPANAFSERACLDGKNLYINNLTKFCQINIIGTPYSSYSYYNGSVYSKIDKIYIYEDGAGYQVMNGTLSIPSDVTSIGRGTFYGCKQLSKVTFPSNGVTQIGDYAFGATKITEVALPATVQTIGSKAFYDTWTESVNTGETDDDGDLIYSSVEWTMALSSLIVPQSVQAIGSNAFNLENNASVTSKNTSPTSISSDAFKNASNCKLKVGLGLQNTYSQKTGWNTFGTIEEEEIIPYIEGEIFTATTPEGIEMTFKVLSATNKTAQVGDGRNPAIDQSFDGDLIIPSQIKGLNITDVGCYAFYDCQNLQSVTIQEGIVRLGETGREENMTYGPFMKAKIAKSINLPSTVTFIGMFSFAYSEIGKFTIPPTVTYLEMCAFKGANIGYLDIPYSETAISYGRERVPGENWTAFGYANIGKLTIDRNINHSFVDGYSSVIAPFSHTTIGELHVGQNGNIHSDLCDCKVTDYYPRLEEELVKGSFYYTQSSVYAGRSSCTNLYLPEGFITITSVPQGTQSISIPSTVTSIAENAFAETNISSVTVYIKDPLPITENTFTDRRLYATLCVPYGCKAAYENADYWKEFKEIIEMPGSIEFADANVESLCIANWDRNGDGKLSTNEAAAVTSLGEVFKGNEDITSFNELQYFTGLTVINDYAFYQCIKLSAVTIPETVKNIGTMAFCSCSALTSIAIPSNVTRVGSWAFAYCNKLKAVHISDLTAWCQIDFANGIANPLNSAHHLFVNEEEVVDLTIPSTLSRIGNYAFYYCKGITSVTIPANITSIGNSTFAGCSEFALINVEEGNDYYDSRDHCNAIIETSSNKLIVGSINTVIPNTVLSIGSCAFYGCSGLTTIIIPESVTSIESEAFTNCNDLNAVTIPKDVTSIGSFAFSLCTKLTSVTILSPVISIGDYAFSGCGKLALVKVGMTMPSTINSNTFSNRTNATLYVPHGSKAAYIEADYWKEFKNIIEFIEGDVNGDGESDVLDVVDIARYVVGTPAETFVPILADINNNGEVNIADAVCLVNDIAGDQNFAKPNRTPKHNAANETLLLTTDNENYLSLALQNERDYTAFQFDLYVPDGTDVTQMLLNAQRKRKHQLLYNKVEDGHWRVAALSTSNRTFNGNNGELFSMVYDGIMNDEVAIRNIHFFTADGSDYQFDDISLSGTTAIHSLNNGQGTNVGSSTVYDMQGRKIMSGDSSNRQLPKGLYIINGKKVVIK